MAALAERKAQRVPVLSDDDEDVINLKVCLSEAGRTLRLALPLGAQLVSVLGLTTTTMSFIGQLGATELSVASLAVSLYYLSGLAVVVGMAGALEPLCGQAFGAKKYRLVGIICQRALVMAAVVCTAISLLWTQAEWFFIAVGQVPSLAAMAAKFVQSMTPVLCLESIFSTLSRYLISQGVVYPTLIGSVTALCSAPFFCNFFIHQQGLGLQGGPAALCASYTVLIVVLVTLVAAREWALMGTPEQTFPGWSMEPFNDIGPYLRLALPLVGITCLEWWGYEAVLFAAGWLTDPHLAIGAMGISNTIVNITCMLPLGLAFATTAQISNKLGENRPNRAKLVAKISLVLSIALLSVLSAGQIIFREGLTRLWTADTNVLNLTVSILPVVALSEFCAGQGSMMFGILHGCKRGSLGLRVSLVSYWAVGVPLALVLGLHCGWGVLGFWWGTASAALVQAVCLFLLLKGIDFKREAVGRGEAAPTVPVA